MIYLDYASTSLISMEATDAFLKTSKDYFGLVSSNNKLGSKCKKKFIDTTKEISDFFNIMSDEIIYTTSEVEASNMALIGYALKNSNKGKHIIVSRLEDPSIYSICNYLETQGFEISYVHNDEEGLVSFEDLKKLIREDTILVSISLVNSETGVRQPLKMLRQIIKKENEQVVLHSDFSNAIGRTQVNFHDVDLASISSHKLGGPKGIGFLYKSSQINLEPLLYGSNKNKNYRPGEISLPLVVSMKVAIKNAIKDLDKKERYINLLNDRIISKISKFNDIKINKTKYSIPHIINISFDNISSELFINALSSYDIFIAGNLNNELSSSVYAIYGDGERSKSVIRISLSSNTTILEINRFLEVFELEYERLRF